MFIYNYENVNPESLNDETNQYDMKNHLPIPSFDHVFNETSIDMIKGIGENEAKGVLLYITKFTMNTIKSLIPLPSRNMVEFLIAKDENYRKGFIDTVCSVISTTRGKGLSDFLATGQLGEADLPKVVQATANANNLLIQFYSMQLPTDWIRRDY